MTDPIAEGVKLEDAIVILREGLRSDRPLTLKERLLIGKIIDERAALTAAGEMAGESAELKWKLDNYRMSREAPAAPASPVGEDVEKVARAICDKIHEGADYGMDGASAWDKPHARKHFMELAEAALAAIGRT